MDEICRGCSSYKPEEHMSINGIGLTCELKPIYKGKQCPCITCLVKMRCMSDDSDCHTYYKFAKIQEKDGVFNNV